MAKRDKSDNNKRGELDGSSQRSTPPQGVPVVLVPATPDPASQPPAHALNVSIPPSPSPPSSPRNYAQAAARPAAINHVVVWPRNPPTLADPLATPALVPMEVLGGDVMEPLEFPPPALVKGEEMPMESTPASVVTSDISSLPSSSPIRYTSSISLTPVATRASNVLASTPRPIGETAVATADSYDNFWAQFDSPIVPATNLPAALQAPRILTDHEGNAPNPLFWPILAQQNAQAPGSDAAGNENIPPASETTGSHPPVASRFRKRRRGTSPVPGERVKKSARRKEKQKGPVPCNDPEMVMENPWSLAESAPPQGSSRQNVLYPPSLPAAVFPTSMNHSSYDDFARSSYVNTSFYGRLNNSASFPTPHAAYNTPPDPDMSSPSVEPPIPPINRLAESSPPSRAGSMASAQQSVDINWTSEGPVVREGLGHPPPSYSRSRDVSMNSNRSSEEEASLDGRRRLRDILSDPSSLEDRPRTYQAPSVEDIPEEGELYSPYASRASSMEGWGSSRVSSFSRSSRSGLSLLENPAVRDRRFTSFATSRRSIDAAFYDQDRSSTRARLSYERSSRQADGLDRDESNPRLPSLALPSSPPSTQLRHSQRDALHNSSLPPAPLNPPSSRLNSLDIFDVGNDDNMPDAVRRGGTSVEADEERPTPIPHEGDPEVHRHDPEAHLRGMSDDWIKEVWADPAGTSITLSTFNPRFSRSYGTNRRTASDLRRSIASITGESTFLVIAPDHASDFRGRGPVEWAITGLSAEGVERLLRRRVWSFKTITFFPRRRSLDNPRWILALEGFLEDNADTIQRAVRSTFERPQVRQRIEQMIRANPEYANTPVDEAFRRIMATLRITIYSLDNDTVVANVFLHSPTQSIRVWRRWIQELRDITFGSYRTAIARARRISACAGCLGVDHPSHLCPFPRMIGWNGPPEAGGQSYSADGREFRAGGLRSNPSGRQTHPPAASSRSRQAARPRGNNWSTQDDVRGRDRADDYGRDRTNDRRSNGQQWRARRESSRPPKGGRDSFQKDSRR